MPKTFQKFDVLADPITPEALQDLRDGASARVEAIRRLGRWARRMTIAAGLAVSLGVASFWPSSHSGVSGASPELDEIVGIGLIAAVAGAGTTLALLTVWFAGYPLLAPDAWDARVADKRLRDLQELDPETRADSCLELADICRTDPVVGAYVQKLTAAGRKPVVAEYLAALRWFGEAEARRKVAAARAACNEFKDPGSLRALG